MKILLQLLIMPHYPPKLFLLLPVLAILASCEQRPVEINLPQEEEKMTLIGILLDGIPLEVYFGKTQQFNSETIDYEVDDPLIILFEDGIPIDTIVYFEAPPNSGDRLLVYRSKRIVSLQPGSCYYLTAEAEGLPSIRTELQCYEPKLQVDTVQINAEITREFPENEDGFSPIRILISSVATSIRGNVASGEVVLLQIFGSRGFYPRIYYNKGAEIEVPIPLHPTISALDWVWENSEEEYYLEDRRNLIVEITRYPADYEHFINTINAQSEEISGFAPSSEPVPNNIINGYGYFSVGERYASTFEL
jgi:hypothetical protein